MPLTIDHFRCTIQSPERLLVEDICSIDFVNVSLTYKACGVSLFHLLVIAWERYMAVLECRVQDNRHKRPSKKKRMDRSQLRQAECTHKMETRSKCFCNDFLANCFLRCINLTDHRSHCYRNNICSTVRFSCGQHCCLRCFS